VFTIRILINDHSPSAECQFRNLGGDNTLIGITSFGTAQALVAESPIALPRIQQCTSGDWYWEVITPERESMARGLALSSAQARADAVKAGQLYNWGGPVFGGSRRASPG
jgi:hypothetical protein